MTAATATLEVRPGISRRLAGGLLFASLAFAAAFLIAAATLVPSDQGGYTSQVQRLYHGVTARFGLAVGMFEVEDARKLVAIDPGLSSPLGLGQTGAEYLAANAEDPVERLAMAGLLVEVGHDDYFVDALDHFINEKPNGLDAALAAVGDLETGSDVRSLAANRFGTIEMIERYGVEVLWQAVDMERTPFLLNAIAVRLDDADMAIELLEEALVGAGDDLTIRGNLWAIRKARAVAAGDRDAALEADEELRSVIDARGADAPHHLHEAAALAVPAPPALDPVAPEPGVLPVSVPPPAPVEPGSYGSCG